jgi:uncharacterized membrane protein
MAGLAAIVFDDQLAAARFRTRLEELEATGVVRLLDLALVHRRPDERITLELPRSAGGGFWGLLVGLLLWPRWLGVSTPLLREAVATLDVAGVTSDWADAVARSLAPGDVAVLVLVDTIPEAMLAAVRETQGDLFPVPLSEPARSVLLDIFGGAGSAVGWQIR